MFRIITMPFDPQTEVFEEAGLNDFLMNKDLRSYRVEFFTSKEKTYWSIFLDYEPLPLPEPHREKDIEKEALSQFSEVEKKLYFHLKTWRAAKARQEGIPSYVICHNRQLIECVKIKPTTMEALKSIQGIGSNKAKRFGKEIVEFFIKLREQNGSGEK